MSTPPKLIYDFSDKIDFGKSSSHTTIVWYCLPLLQQYSLSILDFISFIKYSPHQQPDTSTPRAIY